MLDSGASTCAGWMLVVESGCGGPSGDRHALERGCRGRVRQAKVLIPADTKNLVRPPRSAPMKPKRRGTMNTPDPPFIDPRRSNVSGSTPRIDANRNLPRVGPVTRSCVYLEPVRSLQRRHDQYVWNQHRDGPRQHGGRGADHRGRHSRCQHGSRDVDHERRCVLRRATTSTELRRGVARCASTVRPVPGRLPSGRGVRILSFRSVVQLRILARSLPGETDVRVSPAAGRVQLRSLRRHAIRRVLRLAAAALSEAVHGPHVEPIASRDGLLRLR